MTASEQLDRGAGRPAGVSHRLRAACTVGVRQITGSRRPLAAVAAAWLLLAPVVASAQDAAAPAASVPAKARVEAAIPAFEAMVEKGMADFAVPGAAVGIVVGDELVYAKGFGVRRAGGEPVDTATVFQIGSATKAFLATTLAILVEEKKLDWAQRVVGVDPGFILHDPWVTREFRIFDLLAQRSGMRPYVNDVMTGLGYDGDALIRSLRFAEPVTSFRSAFGYVNILHLIAGRIVARLDGKADWFEVATDRILAPLGMTRTTGTAEAIEAEANHADGHRWDGSGAVAIPFDPSFPYALGPAGNLNSSVDDMAKWVRMLLARGTFEGRHIVAEEGLRYTWTPKVALNDQQSYALGWVVQELPEGRVIWHNGGTSGFGAHVGMVPEEGVGIVILSNLENRGFADAAAMWFYRRILGEPEFDHIAQARAAADAKFDAAAESFSRPETPRPPRPLADLAGAYETQAFGAAAIRVDGDRLVLTLQQTGAELALAPFDGDVFTVGLLPEGRFAKVVAMNGEQPAGFAQFQMDEHGRLTALRLVLDEQPYLLDKAD